ncbi:MAG: protein phosphatase CheZ [Paucibacter sp.]|nr:protein phosphatase CheZ [Roseateles sp.]
MTTVESSAAVPSEALRQLSAELPDTCERLGYVRKMTEQAANKVLDLVDTGRDAAEQVRRQGADLSEMLSRHATAPELTLERARSMLKLCAAYAATAAAFAEREKHIHAEIMQAQDFQDLSGQVINKVVRMLNQAEGPLNELLAQLPAPDKATEAEALAGVQTPDKALQQDDVDDLMASLGF